ncbi:MAG TPA: ATP-binding protein [Symbiobacteriaceae bacterium]|nr:ATP-binding protein [Symbiobacteriaceae bacterium]
MSKWWSHLKLKVLAFGAVMSVLPLAVFGWYSMTETRAAQLEVADAQNQAGARIVAEQLDQFIRQLQTQMQLLTRTADRELGSTNPADQERVLYALLRDAPHLEDVTLVAPDGRELVRVSRRDLTARTTTVFPQWPRLVQGETSVGAVTLDADGRPLVQIGVPMPDGGALVGRATLRGMLANIAAVRGNGSLRVHVLDESGRLIGDSDFSPVLAGARVPLPPDSLMPYRSITGEDAIGTTVPLVGVAWRVIGETPLDAALAPVHRLRLEFASAAVVLMLLVIALSVIFGLQLTEPLERLEAGARRIGQGELTYRIPEGGRDELGRLVAAFNSMTERLQAQSDALRMERDQLDTVVTAVGVGLALIDPDGRVLWVNHTLSDWFPGALLGRYCWEALGRQHCPGPAAGCCGPGTEQQVMIGGRPRLIRYTAYPLGGDARPGEPYRLSVLEDVTERRTMEAMVLQSEKLAAVGQLAAGVAHEINNPLAVIAAYAQDLEERLQEEGATALEAQGDLASYLQQLQVQVQRCKGITTNLLDFARRGPAEPEPVDAEAVARATAALVGARARKAAVAVQVDLPAGLPPVRASRDQLQQVFLNLITNALDAMEAAGGGTITITGGVEGDYARVDVTDTGPGMDQTTLARAMEPFFTTKPPGKGTGLGLSTCYGILTGLGGNLTLESEPGKGTTVTFTLPVWREQHA